MNTTIQLIAKYRGRLLIFLCSLFFVQPAFSQKFPQPVKCKVVRGCKMPQRNSHHSNMKSLGDTTDVLDYNTYNEIMANNLQITYNGSWNGSTPQPYGIEITSFVTIASADVQSYQFAQMAFDSFAFANYQNQSIYSIPRTGTAVTVDSIGMFIGIAGDTVVSNGTMAHDSLLIGIYRVVGHTVSAAPVMTIVNAGYAGLQKFIVGTTVGQLLYAQVPVGQQFNPGESFAVRVTYLNKDTSSHCILAYSYADSCGTITYQGQQYSSPAYPSPFAHSSSFGEIDSISPGIARVTLLDNQSKYNIPGTPTNCLYVYPQSWEILPYVTLNVQYGAQIQAGQTTVCGNTTVALSAAVFGTDSPNITYQWAVNGGGGLVNSTSASTSVTVAGNVTNNVTVTLTVNNGFANVTDSLVFINCHLNVNAGNSQTVCTGSNVILTPTVTGGTAPFTYQWQATGSALSCSNCANPAATVSQNSVYTVTVTDAVSGTATSTVSYNITGTVNQVQVAVTNTGIGCSNQYDTTVVTVTGGTAPYNFNWGDGTTSSGASPLTNYYGLPGGPKIIAVTDAGGCVTAVYDTVVNAGPSVAFASATSPGCPNSATGQIIVSVTGGSPPYNYNWGNSVNSDTLANAASGNYQLVVTDAHSCTALFNYSLSSLRDFNYYVFMNATDLNCNLGGSVTTGVTGGTTPYSYLWNNGATTANIYPTTAANYSVTITDSLGCQTFGNYPISNFCQSIISGFAFIDTNSNCTYDVGESPLSNIYISAVSATTGYTYYGSTDNSGHYSFAVNDAGAYTLNAFTGTWYNNTCGSLTFCGNSNQTVTVSVLGDSVNAGNIGLSGATGFNLGIHPGWTSANPGFSKRYWVFYYNSSPISYTGPATITFVYDSNLIYQNTDLTPAPAVDVNAHTLTWTVDMAADTSQYGFYWLQVDANFMVPASLSLNYLLQNDFTITPVSGDCNPQDNHYHYTETVIGSHDPNEKTVSPAGSVTAEDSVLTYTIHFQNTGTDSTHFVIIKDTLSPNLAPSTVHNIASSDKYSSFTITGNGILTWTFNPLRIVDSMTNPSGSKRFIMFTVKKKGSLAIGTTISNTASIYFDYNDAVVTNTVRDTETWPLYVYEISNDKNVSVRAFPNPFSDVTNIVVTGLTEKFGFELYDVTGRIQQTIPSVDNSQFQVHRGQLARGVYLYRIIVANKPAAYGKLVVE